MYTCTLLLRACNCISTQRYKFPESHQTQNSLSQLHSFTINWWVSPTSVSKAISYSHSALGGSSDLMSQHQAHHQVQSFLYAVSLVPSVLKISLIQWLLQSLFVVSHFFTVLLPHFQETLLTRCMFARINHHLSSLGSSQASNQLSFVCFSHRSYSVAPTSLNSRFSGRGLLVLWPQVRTSTPRATLHQF